jgi:hypothetical protein
MTTIAVHPSGLNAAQSLAFFRANNIRGRLVSTRFKNRILVQYTCPTVFLDSSVSEFDHRILAPRDAQHLSDGL